MAQGYFNDIQEVLRTHSCHLVIPYHNPTHPSPCLHNYGVFSPKILHVLKFKSAWQSGHTIQYLNCSMTQWRTCINVENMITQLDVVFCYMYSWFHYITWTLGQANTRCLEQLLCWLCDTESLEQVACAKNKQTNKQITKNCQ